MSRKPRRADPREQAAILTGVLDILRDRGRAAVVAFDLDSTLLDNRPRQARIVREWGTARAVAPARECRTEHLDGWDLRVALRNAGVAAERADELYPDLKQFWREHFFTSEYCRIDDPIQGARDYLAAVTATRARLCYVTGRHEPMGEGTIASFERLGYPLPDGDGVQLLLKPTFEMDDDAWKREAYARLERLGAVKAAFDNEPTHANAYLAAFPAAIVVHVDTDHSGRPVEVHPSIRSIADFRTGP